MAELVFVFSGQGSQYPGMGKDFYEKYQGVRAIYEEAEKLYPGITGLCFNEDEDAFKSTVNLQPALFMMQSAIAGLLDAHGVVASMTAGFSAGESAAIAYAEALSFEDMLTYVFFRGRVMEEAARAGKTGMAAILGLKEAGVEKICKKIERLWPVNYNAPGQTVIAGDESSLDEAAEAVKEAGGKIRRLDVSGAFHSPLMQSASSKAAEYLSRLNFNDLKVRLYGNTTAKALRKSDGLATMMAGQISSPVLWQKSIENMIKGGAGVFVEIGPGKVLSGLIRRINPEVEVFNIDTAEAFENTLKVLKEAKYAER